MTTGGNLKKASDLNEISKTTDASGTISKSYEFYVDSLEELQNKLRSLDQRFAMINLILESRNITEDDMTKDKINSLVNKSKEVNAEELKMNFDEKNTVEIYKLMEEAFNDKLKTFKLKKQFMENIKKMKESQQTELSKLFDRLNSVEDEYIITERFLSNAQVAIKQNLEEVKSSSLKIGYSTEEKTKLEAKNKKLEEDLKILKMQQQQKTDELTRLQKLNDEMNKQISTKIIETEHLQAKLVTERLYLFEQQEKLEYINQVSTTINKDLIDIGKLKSKKEAESVAKMNALKEIVKTRAKSEEEIKKLEILIKALETGESVKQCLCDLKDDVKKGMNSLIQKSENLSKSKQPFSFYEQMISEFILEKDVNLNHLIGLTISSHFSQKDKITKINQIYQDRNLKLIDYLADVLFKSNTQMIKNYFNFAVNLKKMNLDKLMVVVKSAGNTIEEVFATPVIGKGVEPGVSLKLAILLTRIVDEGLSGILEV